MKTAIQQALTQAMVEATKKFSETLKEETLKAGLSLKDLVASNLSYQAFLTDNKSVVVGLRCKCDIVTDSAEVEHMLHDQLQAG